MQLRSIVAASLVALCTAADAPTCGEGLAACPKEFPCCSAEGTCGNGYVCLGGCDPRFSNTPGACMPMPVCKNAQYDLSSADSLLNYTSYRGDAEKNPFIYVGNVTEANGKVRAVMTENNPATTIILNHYVWYGKVSIDLKASHGPGVISTFILLSDAKDEIDYEMVGSELTTAQTNYYYHGILDYTHMKGASVTNVNENTLTYTIDWKEDQIDWIINGNTVRTLKKEDTKNSTTGEYNFPQTPQRVEFGLWAAGDSPFEGTAAWAGGVVDWSAAGPEGYYYVEASNLQVTCYDPPAGTTTTGGDSYVYLDSHAFGSEIAITGNSTILESLDGTGENPCGSQCSSSSASSDSDSGATLGGSVASTSTAASSTDAVLSGSKSASTSEAETTSAASESESASASASESESASESASASATGSASASSSASARASSSAQNTASSAGSSSAGASSANGAVVAGAAAALLAPLAFIL